MDLIKQVILAIVQGITELLPVSSSAHLLITAQLLKFNADTYFLTTLHLGTAAALLLYYWELLFTNILSKKKIRLYVKIAVSTLPAAITGFLFQSFIEEKLRANIIMAISLVFWGILMIVFEKIETNPKEKEIEEITWKESLVMGFAQTLALIPGTSRSGVTTIAGLIAGVNKFTALQYSFLLGLPILIGTAVYELFKDAGTQIVSWDEVIAITVAGLVGYLALHFLSKFKKGNWLTVIGIYRIILGLTLILTKF